MSQQQQQSTCEALDCLAMHAAIEDVADQVMAAAWVTSVEQAERTLADLQGLRSALTSHIAMMEGPDGLTECLHHHCPRLSRRIADMCHEHTALRGLLGELEAFLECYRRGIGDPAKALALSRQLRVAAREHQDASNALLLDAYHSDLGAGD